MLLFMQSHFIAGIKVGSANETGIRPVSSIGNGQDFDYDSAEEYIYYIEKVNVSVFKLIHINSAMMVNNLESSHRIKHTNSGW